MNVLKPYYELSCDPNAPYLPACYFVMFITALFPPIWRWIVDRRSGKVVRGSIDGITGATLNARSRTYFDFR